MTTNVFIDYSCFLVEIGEDKQIVTNTFTTNKILLLYSLGPFQPIGHEESLQ